MMPHFLQSQLLIGIYSELQVFFRGDRFLNICFLNGEFAKTNFNIQRFLKYIIPQKKLPESPTDSTNISPDWGASAGTIGRVHGTGFFD